MKSTGFNPQFTITNRIIPGLTLIERVRGLLEAATLSENWVRELGRLAFVLEVHQTTHIEGTHCILDKLGFKKPMGYTTLFRQLEEKLA